MKILVVSQYFYPENFRINDFCLELKKRGHTVTVLTGLPNYPEGKIYSGYHFLKKYHDRWQGIDILRIPLIPRMKNKLGLMLNYLSFFMNGCFWAKFSKKRSFDLIYVFEVSPITVALPAITYKKKNRIPVVMNVQDLWPENVEAILGVKNTTVLKMLNRLVDYIYRNCNLLLTSSKCFVENIVARGHSPNKVYFWPQYAEVKECIKNVEVAKMAENEMPKGFNIVFTGNIGEAQGLNTVLETAEKTKLHLKINWIFIGDGRAKEALEKKAKEKKLSNVFFLGRKAEDQIPHYLEKADCALLALSSNKVFDMTLPAKLQTYMACGKPILGSVNGESANVIQESQCGICCPSGDSNGLARAAIALSKEDDAVLKKMSDNSQHYFEKHFSKEKVLGQFFNYLKVLE